jgi:hypothetical protein
MLGEGIRRKKDLRYNLSWGSIPSTWVVKGCSHAPSVGQKSVVYLPQIFIYILRNPGHTLRQHARWKSSGQYTANASGSPPVCIILNWENGQSPVSIGRTEYVQIRATQGVPRLSWRPAHVTSPGLKRLPSHTIARPILLPGIKTTMHLVSARVKQRRISS